MFRGGALPKDRLDTAPPPALASELSIGQGTARKRGAPGHFLLKCTAGQTTASPNHRRLITLEPASRNAAQRAAARYTPRQQCALEARSLQDRLAVSSMLPALPHQARNPALHGRMDCGLQCSWAGVARREADVLRDSVKVRG